METTETLEQGLAFFETVGMPARNLAARTRQEYHNDLTDLITFLAHRKITELAQVGLQDLEQYQAEMDRRGYKPATRARSEAECEGPVGFTRVLGGVSSFGSSVSDNRWVLR